MPPPMRPIRKASLIIAGSILGAVLLLILVGNLIGGNDKKSPAGPPLPQTRTVTRQAPPPTIVTEAPPHSQLVDVTLPPGSTGGGDPNYPGIESWHVPLEAPDAAANLRSQIPINGPLDAVPWCSDTSNPKHDVTEWDWEGTADKWISVGVMPYYPKTGVRGPGSEVIITVGPDPSGTGCNGDAEPGG
jgi:hypothetical protein